jgi:hypothetical protein
MGGKSQPDFGDVAASQGEENRAVIKDQLYANRPTQYTPWGYTSWESTPYTDAEGNKTEQWTQTQGLTPELQDILNKQIAIQGGKTDIAGMMTGRMGSEFGAPMDWRGLNPMGQVPTAQYTLPEEVNRQLDYSGIPGMSNPSDVQKNMNMQGLMGYGNPNETATSINTSNLAGVDDPYQTRQAAEDAVYSQAQSRIAPQQESQRASLETKMRNQGLGPQDAAWKSQMQNLANQHNDQNNQAIWSSVDAGRTESGQMFDQQMGRRQQGFGERQSQYDAYNQGMGQRYNQALQGRGQQFGERQAMQDTYNAATGQQFGQTLQSRQQYGNERERQAAFYNQAGQQAYQQALGANAQNFGQSMQGSQYANQIRQQQITEAMTKRGFSLNEINALLSGQQVGMPSMPSFSQAGAAQPAPYMQGAAQQASMDAANNPWSALIGAGATVGGGYLAGR